MPQAPPEFGGPYCFPVSACTRDYDADGVGNLCDNCPDIPNTAQLDYDNDGWGNPCDNCPTIVNADQIDANDNGIGDACEGLFNEYQCGDINADGYINLGDAIYLINFLFKGGSPHCMPGN